MLKASVILVVAVLWSGGAVAQPGVPSASNSNTPSFIDLVGTREGVADPAGAFTVIVRDNGNAVIPSTPVRIRFGNCPDIRPAAVQPYPGLTVDCAQNTVSGTTDSQGAITFVIVGSVLQRALASAAGCAEIRADPGDVLLGSPSVLAYDQDGANGIGPNDVWLTVCDVFAHSYFPRSDYNHSGSTNTVDINFAFRRYVAGAFQSAVRCDGEPAERFTVAESGGINLAWEICRGRGGLPLTTFACVDVGDTTSLIASIVAPPGVTSLVGFEAEVIVESNDAGSPLPDWWRFDSGACREGAASFISVTSLDCPGSPTISAGPLPPQVDYPYLAPHLERIRVLGPGSPSDPLTAGTEYALFRLAISHDLTAECGGCDVPVQVYVNWVRLAQTGGCSTTDAPPDILLKGAASPESNRVFWQAPFSTGVDDIARPQALSLSRLGANSQRDGVAVSFALGNASPASLELFDLAGRRLRARDVGELGAGVHQMTLAAPGELRPGLYFVKLRQGAESRRLKVTVVP